MSKGMPPAMLGNKRDIPHIIFLEIISPHAEDSKSRS